MVGLTGFEPATPCPPDKYATKLRYSPFFLNITKSEKPGSREKKPGFRALGGTRTPNLLIRSQMLYPLSYKR